MGKTVPSFRWALEEEIHSWKHFRNALKSDEDKMAFDELMDMCRNLSSESSCATRPIIFEPMIMSIMVTQQKKIRKLETYLNPKIVEDQP